MSNIDKIAKINLENKPYVKPVSNVDIGFYNLDNGTAKLQFVITRDGFPMQMGPVNVVGYLWLKSTNGSMSGQLDLEIIDGLNGVVGVTIPNWFLVGATDTDVKGQIILAVNENTDIATLGEFGFRVKDALPNQIKGEIKVQYFKMFDDMKQALEGKVRDIETRLGDLDILINNVESTASNGISQIKTTVTNAEKSVGDIKTQANSEIKNASTQAITDVNTAKDSAISTMNSKVEESVNTVFTTSTGAIEHVDGKILEFNTHIEENGFVQPIDLDNKLNELQWQKYKLTNDDGNANFVSGLDMENIEEKITKAGFYWLSAATNGPVNINGVLQAIHGASDSYKKFIYTPHNSNRVFLKSKNGSVWTDWEEISNKQSDTGWIPFQLLNGAISNTEFNGDTSKGFDCSYRIVKNGSVTTKTLRLNGRQLTQGQIIAQLPNDLFEYAHSFPVRVPTSTSYSGGYVTMRPTGEVRFYINGDSSNWNTTTGYLYGEYSWVE